jgi:hypothetical protein
MLSHPLGDGSWRYSCRALYCSLGPRSLFAWVLYILFASLLLLFLLTFFNPSLSGRSVARLPVLVY